MPFLNRAILLSSGCRVIIAHIAVLESQHRELLLGLGLTVSQGLIFTGFQAYEYYEAPFTLADSVYGSTFFVATGFHGLHVIVGTLFLTVIWWRAFKCHFTSAHHVGLEAAA